MLTPSKLFLLYLIFLSDETGEGKPGVVVVCTYNPSSKGVRIISNSRPDLVTQGYCACVSLRCMHSAPPHSLATLIIG